MTHPVHPECPNCICGKRAPVQADAWRRPSESQGKGPGTIAWWEHELAWSNYARQYGTGQSAQRMAERGGFGYAELTGLLGHAPLTWTPRGVREF